MKVECDLTTIDLDGDDPRRMDAGLDSVCATCTRCDHETSAYSTSADAIRLCLEQMRKECPEGEQNEYIIGDNYLDED